MGAPMYNGSSLSFLGTALLYGRPAGVVLSGLVWVVYGVALSFEEYVFSLFFDVLLFALSFLVGVGMIKQRWKRPGERAKG